MRFTSTKSIRLILLNPMEKGELIQLVEGPIFTKYGNLLKRKLSINVNNNVNEKIEPIITKRINTSNESKSSPSSPSSKYSMPMPLTEAQKDRRTVFVQQLSVRCTDRNLSEFFTEHGCPVRNARLVLDKYTRKSKGVAYVEFFEEDSVRVALKLSGTKLIGVPIIVELTETEKNRIAQEAAGLNPSSSDLSAAATATTTTTINMNNNNSKINENDDFFKLYVGSLHPSLTELELEKVFEPFGVLESVKILKDEKSGGSKGVAFVQYKRSEAAKTALEALNGFELAGRVIRVGPVRTEKSSNKNQSTSTSTSTSTPSNFISSSKSQQKQAQMIEVDDEENLSLDPKKRTELMQKLLSSRKQ